jgi:hypothetical protein
MSCPTHTHTIATLDVIRIPFYTAAVCGYDVVVKLFYFYYFYFFQGEFILAVY